MNKQLKVYVFRELSEKDPNISDYDVVILAYDIKEARKILKEEGHFGIVCKQEFTVDVYKTPQIIMTRANK